MHKQRRQPEGPQALRRTPRRVLLAGIVALLALLISSAPRQAVRADGPPPPDSISLASSLPSGQLVDTTVVFTATAVGPANPVFRFSVAPPGGPFRVVRDFSGDNEFSWTPLDEGDYHIKVTVKDGFNATTSQKAALVYHIAPRVTGDTAVITATDNPLIALYSAPPCAAGRIWVIFQAGPSASWTSTASQPCLPGISRNFLIAGMRRTTAYLMAHVVDDGTTTTTSATQTFTTGDLPTSVTFPSFTVRQDPGPGADLAASTVLHLGFGDDSTANPVATDLGGQVVWYYNARQSGFSGVFPVSIVPGGTLLMFGADPAGGDGGQSIREVDLAGHPLRETNIDALNAELAARGQEQVYALHHDIQRLPNGQTALLANVEHVINGRHLVGDMIIVLDQDLQVVWTWNSFDFLDVHRHATLDDQTTSFLDPTITAEDWTHSNAVAYSPADGDLTLSIRSQDWVIKIDYRDGAGDGHILWRLGPYGDFSNSSSDPFPWNSHQHNAHFIDNTTMVLFDNGNTRCQSGDPACHSRGQALSIDEGRRVVTPLLNADLGSYSGALGAAQHLDNGNYHFTAGYLYSAGAPTTASKGRSTDPVTTLSRAARAHARLAPLTPRMFGQSIEVQPDGTISYILEMNALEYRSYRLHNLYESPDPVPPLCQPSDSCATPTETPTDTATSTPTATDSPTDTPTATETPTDTPTTPPTCTVRQALLFTLGRHGMLTTLSGLTGTADGATSRSPLTFSDGYGLAFLSTTTYQSLVCDGTTPGLVLRGQVGRSLGVPHLRTGTPFTLSIQGTGSGPQTYSVSLRLGSRLEQWPHALGRLNLSVG